MNKTGKYIFGYAGGGLVFLVLIPAGIYYLSVFFDSILMIKIFPFQLIKVLLAFLFFIPGAVFMVWSNLDLFFKGKGGPADVFNVAVSPRTLKLVISGPYHFSRNPMVLGAFLCYFGLSILLDSLLCFLFLILFLMLVVFYLKMTEEKRLLKDFGQEYLDYKKKVPMIFPYPRFKM